MSQPLDMNTKPVGTREWYDFIGLLADMIPYIHMGGQDATQRLIEFCSIDKKSTILDVGCGGGNTSCLIVKEVGASVVGIDISDVMISKAQQRAERLGISDRVEFRTADAYDIPFNDNSFDVVLVESVLVPLPGDKMAAIKEMMRVLKPGGMIGVNESTVRPQTPQNLIETFLKHPATYGTFTPKSLKQLFESAGFENIKIQEFWNIDTPSPMMGLGCRGLLNFLIQVYPRIVLKLLRDKRFREASRIDNQITKGGKEYMGYVLVVGQNPKDKGGIRNGYE
jgi:SAM-dependent methyltransferase